MNKRVELRDVTAGYNGKAILKDVSLDIWEHDFLGITGPNGGGKTTLLKVILGLLPPQKGTVRRFAEGGNEVPALRTGYLPQVNAIDKRFPISVREVVASGLISEKPLFRNFTPQQWERIDDCLRQMGVEALSPYPIGELSGGQLQRTLLARAVVSRPQLLVLDEPETYIDKPFGEQLVQVLKGLNRQSAIILVSHDLRAMEPLITRSVQVDATACR